MSEIDFKPCFSRRQTEALAALDDPGVSEVGFGGAKSGGKSIFGCLWMCYDALRIIAEHKLQRCTNPLLIGWMGRKRSVDFRDTTLETWKQIIPAELYQIKDQAQEIIIAGAVKIGFGGLDNTDAVQKFQSAQLCRIFLDQAEETSLDDVGALRASTDRPIANVGTIPGKMLFTFNPAPGWVWDQFVLSPGPRQRFVQALVSDNPWVNQKRYVERLKESFGHRPELLKAYLEGVLVDAGSATLIRMDWVRDATTKRFYPEKPTKFYVADIARFGDEMMEMVQRYVTGAVTSLDARLKALEGTVVGVKQATAETREQQFYALLTSLVPQWQQINADNRWLQWLGVKDEVYGLPRQAALDNAQKQLDAQQVAKVFNAFIASLPAVPVPPSVESQLAPDTAGNTPPPAPTPAPMFSEKAVTAFYKDQAQGKYVGREAEAREIEAQIDLAVLQGRITR